MFENISFQFCSIFVINPCHLSVLQFFGGVIILNNDCNSQLTGSTTGSAHRPPTLTSKAQDTPISAHDQPAPIPSLTVCLAPETPALPGPPVAGPVVPAGAHWPAWADLGAVVGAGVASGGLWRHGGAVWGLHTLFCCPPPCCMTSNLRPATCGGVVGWCQYAGR